MAPFVIMLIGGAIAAAVAAAKAKPRVPEVDPRLTAAAKDVPPEIAAPVDEAAENVEKKLNAADVGKAVLMKALPVLGTLVAITKIVQAIGAKRKAGIENFEAIFPLMDTSEQRQWIGKKNNALKHKYSARRHKDLRKYEEAMVNKYKGYDEATAIKRIKDNMRYLHWMSSRPTNQQVPVLRGAGIFTAPMTLKPVVATVEEEIAVAAKVLPPAGRAVVTPRLITLEVVAAATQRVVGVLRAGVPIRFVNAVLANEGIVPAAPGKSAETKSELAYETIARSLKSKGFVEMTGNLISAILKRPPPPQATVQVVASVSGLW